MNAGLVEQGTRAREIVEAGDVQIEVIAEGRGPLVVLLPSAARDSEDFDIVAEGIAATGFACFDRSLAAWRAALDRCNI